MENITLKDIAMYTQATYEAGMDLSQKVKLISNDSRTQDQDWVYLALVGERLDGHDYVKEAMENGAIAVIAQRPGLKNSLLTKDTYQALKDIAIGYKNRYQVPYIAVTGSSGKTTTKDMMYYALNESEKTLRNMGNLNSEIGLPMTLLNLDDSYECAVLEMGMYNLGEIDYLAEIVKPHIGVITNVGIAHLMNLKTRENILKAKMEIANYMSQKDFLLINGDNDLLQTVDKKSIQPRVYTFGMDSQNDIYVLEDKSENNKTFVKASILGEIVEFEIPTIGQHNIYNALSAMGVCKLLGLDLKTSAEGLKKYQPSKYRMEKSEVGGKLVINDCYNANPYSMKASISTLDQVAAKRKVAVLADMLELGEESDKYHFEIGELLTNYVDVIIAIGDQAANYIDGAKSAGFSPDNMYHFKNNEEAIREINSILLEGDAIIIKGSRGMKLEEVADSIC